MDCAEASLKPTRCLTETPVQFVSDLIEEGSNQWNEQLVREVSMPPHADLILPTTMTAARH